MDQIYKIFMGNCIIKKSKIQTRPHNPSVETVEIFKKLVLSKGVKKCMRVQDRLKIYQVKDTNAPILCLSSNPLYNRRLDKLNNN
jgi:hypothetical protein